MPNHVRGNPCAALVHKQRRGTPGGVPLLCLMGGEWLLPLRPSLASDGDILFGHLVMQIGKLAVALSH